MLGILSYPVGMCHITFKCVYILPLLTFFSGWRPAQKSCRQKILQQKGMSVKLKCIFSQLNLKTFLGSCKEIRIFWWGELRLQKINKKRNIIKWKVNESNIFWLYTIIITHKWLSMARFVQLVFLQVSEQ